MNKLYSSIITLLILALFQFQVRAEDNNSDYLLSIETYEVLGKAQTMISEGDTKNAIRRLNTYLNNNSNLKKYDIAVVQQTLGYAYHNESQYKKSINAFQQAVNSEKLPEKVAHKLRYILAQLLIHDESYDEGLEYLKKWLNDEPSPSAEAHLLAATAYYQKSQFQALIPHIKKAIDTSSSPQQSWYELLLAAYYETASYKNAIPLLKKMIQLYPDKHSYWQQLSGMYQQNKQDKKALAVSELAYEKGLLKGDSIVQLAQTYLYLQMPYKSANVLDSALTENKIAPTKKNILLLADSWLLAQEEKQAANSLESYIDNINDVSLYFKLGHILISLEDWGNAKNVLEKTSKMLNQTKSNEITSNTWLLLGIAAYHEKQYKQSLAALDMAKSFEKTMEQADWWIGKIKEEQTNI